MIGRADIAAAHERIAPYIRHTPVLDLGAGELGVDHPVTLKLEHLQRSGSFKARGAFNNLLSRTIPDAGVVAVSGGNHGAAVALAARELGVSATVFVPKMIAKEVKLARMRDFGATVVLTEGFVDDVWDEYNRHIEQTGALEIHPYDSAETLAGQGSVAKEFDAQVPDLDTLLVSVGGGGLIGGIAAWYGGKINIVAVESHSTATLANALQKGPDASMQVSGIAASSLGASVIGALPWEVLSSWPATSVQVSDADIFEAQRRLWSATRLLGEPGAACALAALTSGAYKPASGERVGVLICGGNAEPDWFMAEGQ